MDSSGSSSLVVVVVMVKIMEVMPTTAVVVAIDWGEGNSLGLSNFDTSKVSVIPFVLHV